jgi:hypothetical protein
LRSRTRPARFRSVDIVSFLGRLTRTLSEKSSDGIRSDDSSPANQQPTALLALAKADLTLGARLVGGHGAHGRHELLVPAQEYAGKFLEMFKDFPPRQRSASFNLDEVMAKLSEATN